MRIYINQAGYQSEGIKTAILAEEAENQGSSKGMFDRKVRFFSQDDETCILEKQAEYFGLDKESGDFIWRVDFSELTQEGNYQIECEGEKKVPFCILNNVYDALTQTLCKALYYQRCGMELQEEYAGIFKRESCHEDTAVLLEDYEKLNKRDHENIQQFDVRGGWHDAGDYGKYTTAAATALAHIFYAYQFFPDSFQASLNIPESGNSIPDILNECLYEVRWLMKMQMKDGSVRHKVTSMRHANFVMPHEDKSQMILFPASTMAGAGFAAIMALASRIYKQYDLQLAQDALAAAEKAWNWLEEHPEFIGFENPEGCNTGDYTDDDDRDERIWAAAELYQTTGEEKYLVYVKEHMETVTDLTAMGWSDVAGFAGWAFLAEKICKTGKKISLDESELQNQFRNAFLKSADALLELVQKSGYFVAMEGKDYGWGSNMVIMNRAMILGTAYLLESKSCYRDAVVRQMDYLLGVNATGYSYVTAVGRNACQNPHNRVTVADGIQSTIPGFVVGGANAKPADEKAEWLIKPGTFPMKSFFDVWECYSLNEITIYWNSPAIFVAGFLTCK